MNISHIIADELELNHSQVNSVIKLLDEGATIPFIARYRKEVTGGVTDTQLRLLLERLEYLKELEARRTTILKTISEQGKLTDTLKNQILNTNNKTTLEDLYLPFKPKRRTKAQIAKESGLEPLAHDLLENANLNPEVEAEKYIDSEKNILDVKAALEGARHILMEYFTENAELLGKLRQYFWEHGVVTSTVIPEKNQEGIKFSDYFDYKENIKKIPSHRALALFRGSKQGILNINLNFLETTDEQHCLNLIASQFNIEMKNRLADPWLWQTVEWTWKIKFHSKLELELLGILREQSEEEAIHVFQDNLKNLLMMAPAGSRVVMGLDPGLRTGVKVAIVGGTGEVLEYLTIYPHAPKNQWNESLQKMAYFCKKYQVELISIGNGTASRETDALVQDLLKQNLDLKLNKIVVSEAGASVYSASALASHELPDLDVSIRGAVSIARRLQDPLAELVKIDPKSIGVGQYQHDVNQFKLGRGLSGVVEDCVNSVGADVNTASVSLLASISGLNESIATNIVALRQQKGKFNRREELKQVPKLGPKTYEQAIGFLRIIGGENPLDASAVHPESYPIVNEIIKILNQPIEKIIGNTPLIDALDHKQLINTLPETLSDHSQGEKNNEHFGLVTIKEILQELKKPGRDPRPEFKTAEFRKDIESPKDLKAGMILDGVVTNVANFGAFIDIGVHQDGLVHISEAADRYVTNIHDVLKVGQIVQVKVLVVDLARNRINLTMKLNTATEAKIKPAVETQTAKKNHKKSQAQSTPQLSDLAEKLQKALKK